MLSRTARQYEDYRARSAPIARLQRFALWIVLLFFVHAIVTSFGVQLVVANSATMRPAVAAEDRLLLVPLVYGSRIDLLGWQLPGFRDPERGDVVLLRPPYVERGGFFARLLASVQRFFTLHLARPGSADSWDGEYVIKRIVGLPGDTVRLERFSAFVRTGDSTEYRSEFVLSGDEYRITVDDRPPLWQDSDPFGAAHDDVLVPEGHYFVLADDRSGGTDSRHWGTVAREEIRGAFTMRVLPFARFGPL